MVNVLCYGDSNTYGFTPDWKSRYPREVRWPGALQAMLGDEFYVAEDGLIGRTSAFPDTHRYGRSAMDFLPVAIESHSPLDYLIVMLGTNDCKTEKTRSVGEAAAGMEQLVRLAVGMLPLYTKLVLITPPPIHAPVTERDPDFDAQSVTVSEGLAEQHRMIAQAYGCLYLDAGTITRASDLDGEHLDEAGHAALAAAVAELLLRDSGRA